MNRRGFLGLIGLAVGSRFLPKVPGLPKPAIQLPVTPIIPEGALGTHLSYITRRSYLEPAIMQIYNTSPVLCGMLSKNSKNEIQA